jgi:hypothetical protein
LTCLDEVFGKHNVVLDDPHQIAVGRVEVAAGVGGRDDPLTAGTVQLRI